MLCYVVAALCAGHTSPLSRTCVSVCDILTIMRRNDILITNSYEKNFLITNSYEKIQLGNNFINCLERFH